MEKSKLKTEIFSMNHELRAEDVSFSYKEGISVIEHLSFSLKRGRLVMLLGPNGNGKSTFLKLLAGRLLPQQGTITLDGTALKEIPDRRRALRIAVMPQSAPPVFNYTVREVVMMGRYARLNRLYPPSPEDNEAVDWAMKQTCIDDLADRSCAALSGGERQRVSLASVFASNTPFLLLDEPVSALDPAHVCMIMERIRQKAKSCGILMITHDLQTAVRYGDEMIFMKRGKIAAQGKAEQVMTEEIMSDVYGCGVEFYTLPDGRKCPAFFSR